MKTLAVIPARAGSERIHRKNLRRLGCRTLIGHACASAVAAGVDRVVVSSDDPEMGQICGADRWVKRPPDISGPEADISEAVLHALEKCEEQDGCQYKRVITLQPSLPMRPRGMIKAMQAAMENNGCVAAITVMACVPWVWQATWGVAENAWYPGPYPRSQDVEDAGVQYVQEINSISIADRGVIMAGERWLAPLLWCYLPRWAYADIDTEQDLAEANEVYSYVGMPAIQDLHYRVIHDIRQRPTI